MVDRRACFDVPVDRTDGLRAPRWAASSGRQGLPKSDAPTAKFGVLSGYFGDTTVPQGVADRRLGLELQQVAL